MDIDRDRLEARMQRYFDPKLDDAEIARLMPGAMANTARFDAAGTRKRLVERGFLPYRIMRYCYRPFDARWLYWEPETKLLDEKREGPMRVFNPGSRLLISRPKAERQREGIPFYVASAFPDLHLIRPSTTCFVWDSGVGVHRQSGLSLGAQAPAISDSNLSPAAVAYLASLRDEGLQDLADDLRMHALAVGYSAAYLTENESALTLDWPRVPLPRSAEALRASAALGRSLAALLDSESPVDGVTRRVIRPELRLLGAISRAGGGNLNPDAGDLDVTAHWGVAGRGGITMPGRGRIVEREYTAAERDAIAEGAAQGEPSLGLTAEQALACLGATTRSTHDVYLNDHAYWSNVPAGVWDYTLGGYQVLKKWLSYRERTLLGRGLTIEEAREVTNIVRRIAAILLLGPALDASYGAVVAEVWEVWPVVAAWDR